MGHSYCTGILGFSDISLVGMMVWLFISKMTCMDDVFFPEHINVAMMLNQRVRPTIGVYWEDLKHMFLLSKCQKSVFYFK